MTDIYVIEVTYEKNADDGISYYTDKNKLAAAVYEAENCGGTVKVYKCVLVDHKVFPAKYIIEFYD